MKLTAFMFLVLFSISSYAGNKEHHTPPKISPVFENLKALEGTWEGTTKMNGKEEATKVTYESSSGGTALVEKMMPGTPHEMITVYSNRGNEVNATHFCMLGNQPEMKLKTSSANEFVFEMVGTKGISNKNESHMRAVTLTINGNRLKQEWTSFNKGKKSEVAIFEFTKASRN